MSLPAAAILGLPGPELTAPERALLRQANPWGIILFARNIDTPAQTRRLTATIRDTLGRDAPILIDQEGGRVARLRPPHWRAWPPPLSASTSPRAVWLRHRLIAAELHALGIDVNCAPCADIAHPHTHPFLRDRCYGTDAATVTANARAAAEGLLAGGVLPVIKHLPGHGRAQADSHHDLPRIDTPADTLHATDFAPFKALADLPLAMTAHVVYAALDPRPATTSPPMIALIRSEIGFDGLLISDDLGMDALAGSPATRATAALAAGCDVALHGNGDLPTLTETATAAGPLTPEAQARAQAALAQRRPPEDADPDALAAELATLLPDTAA